MSKKDNKRSKDKKEKSITLKRIISNNIFILKMVCKATPGLLILRVFMSFAYMLTSFFTYTYMLRYAINAIAEGKSFFNILTFICICVTASLIFNLIGNALNSVYYPIKEHDLLQHMRHQVYDKAASVELKCYENTEYYNKFSRAIDESVTRAKMVVMAVADLIAVITGFSANFLLLFSIDPVLLLFSLIPLATIPLTSAHNKRSYKMNMEKTIEDRRKDYACRTFYLSDYAKEMRLTDMPRLMLSRFREAGERTIEIFKKHRFTLAAIAYAKDEIMRVVAPLGATLYAVWQTVGSGAMSYGDCVVVVDSVSMISYTLVDFTDTFFTFQDNALYIENLREFLEYEPQMKDGDKEIPASGDLLLSNVSFRYDGASDYTLKDVTMHIGKNEKIAIVGHNGAGKSTLVKLLLRLYDAEGSISYGGIDIRDFPIMGYRDIYSAVMQDIKLFSLSVTENILLRNPLPGDDDVVDTAIEKAGITKKVETFKNGKDTILTHEFDKDGEVLSGGEAQKIAIAHVYTKQNRFVILDEPSSALDPIAEHEMYESMKAACTDCGMIFISHRLAAAVSADRIYLMENGRIAEFGSHSELMAKNGKYAQMFRHQAENYSEASEI